jgi:hypothetical protein
MADKPHIRETIKEWTKDGVRYEIVKVTLNLPDAPPDMVERMKTMMQFDWYCGYCRIALEDMKVDPHKIDVHGGVTYGEKHSDGTVTIGFDCNHYQDENDPNLKDIDWLTAECERMSAQLMGQLEIEGD